jgi:hypothetical protein
MVRDELEVICDYTSGVTFRRLLLQLSPPANMFALSYGLVECRFQVN